MIDVYLNGIRQIPGIDYAVSNSQISFSQAPAAGEYVQIVNNGHNIANFAGNGSSYLFSGPFANVDTHDAIFDTMNSALKYLDNPAVAEAIEKLRVVVALVKESTPTSLD